LNGFNALLDIKEDLPVKTAEIGLQGDARDKTSTEKLVPAMKCQVSEESSIGRRNDF
tara:strand:+ start:74 stop:244 length:171 start_codon:yes stop_codon:yes gene_type:complete